MFIDIISLLNKVVLKNKLLMKFINNKKIGIAHKVIHCRPFKKKSLASVVQIEQYKENQVSVLIYKILRNN